MGGKTALFWLLFHKKEVDIKTEYRYSEWVACSMDKLGRSKE